MIATDASTRLTAEARLEIESDVQKSSRLGAAYLMFIVCACGIATLGLLQSSAAVVIGAMLISPLMGPIVAMGVSLARLDYKRFNSAAITLAVGAIGSILAAMLIVWISPLKDVTPEILSRTRPTLLDLVVAALSGVVGGFVTVTRKGGTIAGVAIATALMPPLAVLGYGLATGSLAIAGGASLLFATNVVAILAAVFSVARRFGLRPSHLKHGAWETVALYGIIIALCAPLALSLTSIVTETRTAAQVRSDLDTLFRNHNARISDLKVSVAGDMVRSIEAVVVTHQYVPEATKYLRSHYPDAQEVNLEQVLAANEQEMLTVLRRNDANLSAAENVTTPGLDPTLKELLSRVATVDSTQQDGDRVRVLVTMKSDQGLAGYYKLSQSAHFLLPTAKFDLVPPRQGLPPINFATNSSALDAAGVETVTVIAWALQAWHMTDAQVTGFGPAKRPVLSRARARAVADALRAAGVTNVSLALGLPSPGVGSADRDNQATVTAVSFAVP
ncbi:DUF389 domain-containing protein [Asticcacaulis solisilvae]|uniref:DUF389 domain-containing protein n=1 Tax=Asticcacaulis solisilvae TaxID=1217274 RepID=UPI003FD8DFFD